MKKIKYILLVMLAVITSCHNQEWEFPDYDYTTVYFAYQGPVRTIILGEYIYDNTLDNQHKCKIMATTGGAYINKNNIYVDIKVDNSLCDNLYFSADGDKVLPMPSNYYSLSSEQIVIPSRKPSGGIEVQLTDAFFADPLAIKNTYVIPVYITAVQNVDSVLRGYSFLDNPNRLNEDDWEVAPKDYILYGVKYINPWHASWLRRGIDTATGNSYTNIRRGKYRENDEVCYMTTRSMTQVEIALNAQDADGYNKPYSMLLTFDEASKCTVTSEAGNVTGSGEYVAKGDKNGWGNEDRDAIYLNYEVDFGDTVYAVKDTFAMREREVVLETFAPVLK